MSLFLVETNHTGRDIRYRIRGFGLPANQITFIRGDRDETGDASLGEKVSVADFFAEKYRKLQYPHLPCIDGMSGSQKRANWLPMELVRVSFCTHWHDFASIVVQLVAWERSLKPLDSVQRALVTKKSIIKPEQRYGQIMDVVHSRQFQTDPYLKELGIQVEGQEMMKIKGKHSWSESEQRWCSTDHVCLLARILPPPEVKYRAQGAGDVTERVNFGKWVIRNRFFTTRDITKWGMIYFGPKPNDSIVGNLKVFENGLPNVCTVWQCSERYSSCLRALVAPSLWNQHQS
jgi:hypothetical protein